jgi:hypothetical protein
MASMEELWELRRYMQAGDVEAALALLDEMEEMARDDKITRIRSYMKILLTHLIKQAVERRSTRPWDVSIRNAVDEIVTRNKRRKAGGGIFHLRNSPRRSARPTPRP